MRTMIKARLVAAPLGQMPIVQGTKTRIVRNGSVVTLTGEQFIGALVELPHLFRFRCPSCKAFYRMLYQNGAKRRCLSCLEWRPQRRILAKHRRPFRLKGRMNS